MTTLAMESASASRKDSVARAWVQLAIILCCGLFIYGWKLGDSPLDRTEPHRALVAHQMVQSGDWLIPRLFGEVYLRKPPLVYWVQAATEKLFGHGNEFVWRLPSAVGSALLAVFLAWWSGRWFGAAARLAGGFAALAIVAVWEQNRGADIDALNTVASVVTACAILELIFGPTRRPWLWAGLLWLSLGSALLLKGPSGLTTVIGALAGPAIILRDGSGLRKRTLWVGIVAGIATFVAYAALAKWRIQHEGLATDSAGFKEAAQRMLIHHWSDIPKVIGTPFIALLYALPVSLAIPFSIQMIRREEKDSIFRRRVLAILGTVGAGLVVWMIAGNRNPRYEYVVLPLLSPLAGAVAAGWAEGKFSARCVAILSTVLVVFTVIFGIAQIALAAKLWHSTGQSTALLVAGGISILFAAIAVIAWKLQQFRLEGVSSALVILLLAIPLADRKNIERRNKSAVNTAPQLRDIVGAGNTIGVASMVRDMPELFYYSGLNVRAYGEQGLAKLVANPGGQWVVLSENPTFPEYSTVVRDIPGAFPQQAIKLNMPNANDKVYVGWFNPPAQTVRTVHYRVKSELPASEDE